MGKNCFDCGNKIGFAVVKTSGKDLKKGGILMEFNDEIVDKMDEKDVLCGECSSNHAFRNALVIYNWHKKNDSAKDFESFRNHKYLQNLVNEAERLIAEQHNEPKQQDVPVESTEIISKFGINKTVKTNSSFMSVADLNHLLVTKHDQIKSQWDKNGIVQFKDEGLAILQRKWGSQVQFIIACSQVTKEGYRLMAIDEGKEGSSGGFSGGVNAYFYFQKMDFVR